jgi:hypothetical protein
MSGGGSSGTTTQTSTQKETQLSIQQAEILKQREAQYQQYIFPELIKELEEVDLKTTDLPSQRAQTQAINRASEQAGSKLQSDIAQRGLSGSGVEVQALGALQSTRQSALSDAYYNAQQAQDQKKMQLLQMGGSFSPTPTTSAPLSNQSSSLQKQQRNDGMLGLFY